MAYSDYSFSVEPLHEIFPELEPHWRQHYGVYQARMLSEGVKVADYKPRVEQYFRNSKDGWLKCFVVRHLGELVGYATIYVTEDMHNSEKIACEDFIYVTPAHRNGTGRKLTKFVLSELKKLGVKHLHVDAVTDTRSAILWARLGFKDTARHMVYSFEAQHV
jgi:L-amino acid N-acyltransferase YncA